jgi:hypothetical protein
MYAALEVHMGDATAFGEPESWKEVDKVKEWVGRCVEGILRRRADAGGDLFQQGMDR